MDELRSVLARHDPSDPLLNVLRPSDGDTKEAYESIYYESTFSEPLRRSVSRAAATMDAIAKIVADIERQREDRVPGPVVSFNLPDLQEGIERVP